jgi:hypothetical protein
LISASVSSRVSLPPLRKFSSYAFELGCVPDASRKILQVGIWKDLGTNVSTLQNNISARSPSAAVLERELV